MQPAASVHTQPYLACATWSSAVLTLIISVNILPARWLFRQPLWPERENFGKTQPHGCVFLVRMLRPDITYLLAHTKNPIHIA
jgi:hypothetical protein